MAAIPESYGALRLYLKKHLVQDQWKAIVELLPAPGPGRALVEKWTSALNLLDYMQGERAADGLPLLSQARLQTLIQLLEHDAVGAADAAQVVRAFAAAASSRSTDHQLPFVSGRSTFQIISFVLSAHRTLCVFFSFSFLAYCPSIPSNLSDRC